MINDEDISLNASGTDEPLQASYYYSTDLTNIGFDI